MKVYSTKYALAAGVQERDANEGITGSGACTYRDGFWTVYLKSGEWFHTLKEAVADANKRRDRKIASLKKQIAKLEAMTFGE